LKFSVYNLKRRVASLPSITREVFKDEVQKAEASSSKSNDRDNASSASEKATSTKSPNVRSSSPATDSGEEGQEEDLEEAFQSTTHCLFCNSNAAAATAEDSASSLEANLQHMLTVHGLFIPEPTHVSDLATFVRYLATVVSRYHECLYCGAARDSTDAVQQHMRAKGHCMLNFEREPELLEFWEFGDVDVDNDSDENEADVETRRSEARSWAERVSLSTRLSASELLLPSGMIVGSRPDAGHGRLRPGLVAKRRSAIKKAHLKAIAAGQGENAVPEEEEQAGASSDAADTASEHMAQAQQGVGDTRVARRGEMGLIGVTEQQRRALMVTERKMQKREAVARAAYSWVTERIANKQKHYRVSSSNPYLVESIANVSRSLPIHRDQTVDVWVV
jgi:pre-60S factor REI1